MRPKIYCYKWPIDIQSVCVICLWMITSLSWDHVMEGGGSGANLTTQVRFMVEPLLMNRSGPPCISVIGSGN